MGLVALGSCAEQVRCTCAEPSAIALRNDPRKIDKLGKILYNRARGSKA